MKSEIQRNIELIWERILTTFKEQQIMDDVSFDTFLKPCSIDSIKGNKIIISAPNKVAAKTLTSFYKDHMLDVFLEVTGTNYDAVFVSLDELKSDNKDEILNNLINTTNYFDKVKLDPNYTFDTFIEGICNKEAKRAALVAATNPGKIYNPLYIQGNSGLGKTHLLNAIGNFIKEQHSELNVLYTSSTVFMEEYVSFVKGNTSELDLPQFIKQYDCLLIDDIQQIADKTKTLDFFFDIYQAFYTAHKQIVLTSDRYQNALQGIPDRLITRFLQGLTVSINPPDIETSKEILKLKFKPYEEQFTIDDDVIELIANNFQDSIRSLEGVLIRLTFYCSFVNSSHIDLNLAYEALGNQLKTVSKKSKLDENKIIMQVSDFYHVSQAQLTGKTKTTQIVLARQIAIYLIRKLLDTPYKQIGKIFSNRDHSTIMHSYTKVENQYESDAQMKEIIDKFIKNLKD